MAAARTTKESAEDKVLSWSRASLRQRAIQPKLRSMTYRLGYTAKPFWTVRAWVFQGCPHEGYVSRMTCDPIALSMWCEAQAHGITFERGVPYIERWLPMAQRLAEAASG